MNTRNAYCIDVDDADCVPADRINPRYVERDYPEPVGTDPLALLAVRRREYLRKHEPGSYGDCVSYYLAAYGRYLAARRRACEPVDLPFGTFKQQNPIIAREWSR